jgi:hypothetical protein
MPMYCEGGKQLRPGYSSFQEGLRIITKYRSIVGVLVETEIESVWN